MYFTVYLAMFGWPVLVLILFAVVKPRHAILAAFVVGWLFLPVAAFDVPGFPDYTKSSSTILAAVMGAVIFDWNRISKLRFRWFDMPILLCCGTVFVSSISNGLGVYDGISWVVSQVVLWGMPYVIGRVYFQSLNALRELAIAIFLGGLLYVPLCLIEIRLSPQLHSWVYGYHQHHFLQTIRFGGWRPTVFLHHGLMVGMWLASSAVVGVALRMSGSLRELWGCPIGYMVVAIIATTVLCKSLNGIMLMALGIGLLVLMARLQKSWFLAAAIAVAPTYVGLRMTGLWSGPTAVVSTLKSINPHRAQSLESRLYQERLVVEKASQRSILGWGRWSRMWPIDPKTNRPLQGIDALWLHTFGQQGLVGLILVFAVLLLPAVLWIKQWPPTGCLSAECGPAFGLVIVTVLYALDSVLNAHLNPIFLLAIGGLLAVSGTRVGSVVYVTGPRRRDHPTTHRPDPSHPGGYSWLDPKT